jgi:hypothetical protein
MEFRLKHLFQNDQLLKFWPSARQTAEERTYSTVRFVLYASVMIYLITRDTRIFALAALVLAILYMLRVSGMIQEGRAQVVTSDGRPMRGVTMPTFDNPMGNVLITDYQDNPDRPSAGYYPTVQPEIKKQWDIIHPFERQRDAERNFYTVASTTIPNGIDAFTTAAYGPRNAPMCRDTPGACNPETSFRSMERVQQRSVFNRTTQPSGF